jgi:hypothetical protein
MISGRLGQPIETTVAGHAVRLLVRSRGRSGSISITIELLDKPPPCSEDDQRDRQTTESRAVH